MACFALGAILFLKFLVMVLNSLKKFPIGRCTGNIFMLNCFTVRFNSILLWSCIFTRNVQLEFSRCWHFYHVQFIMLFFRSSVVSEHSCYMQDLKYHCGLIVIVDVCCCWHVDWWIIYPHILPINFINWCYWCRHCSLHYHLQIHTYFFCWS